MINHDLYWAEFQIQVLECQVDKMHKTIDSLRSENKELKEKLKEVEVPKRERKQVSDYIDSLKYKVNCLQADIHRKDKKINELKEDNRKLHKEVKEVESNVSNLLDEKDKLKQSIESMKSANRNTSKWNQDLEEKILRLESIIEFKDGEIESEKRKVKLFAELLELVTKDIKGQ